jgi:hypothetical protein
MRMAVPPPWHHPSAGNICLIEGMLGWEEDPEVAEEEEGAPSADADGISTVGKRGVSH